MSKSWMLTLTAIVTSSGCTSMSLERYTINQVASSGECRDKSVLSCLATVAADPDRLPSFALYGDGVTTVQDQVSLSSTTSWTRGVGSFALESLGVTAFRSPKGQWTVDPIVEYERLTAVHCACLWVLYGQAKAWDACPEILGDTEQYFNDKPHFGVASRLEKLPQGWVHCGCLEDVPPCARYKGHCGHTWVWVMPEDSESFAQFTLVLQDIATLDQSSIYSPPLLVTLTTSRRTELPDLSGDPAKNVEPISFQEVRAVKLEYRKEIEEAIRKAMNNPNEPVNLSREQWLACTDPWFGTRTNVTPAKGVSAQTASYLIQHLQQYPAAAPGATAPLLRPQLLSPRPQFKREE
jgi:hypothetical protein